MKDSQYQQCKFQISERSHRYGKNVHLLSSPYLLSILGKICSEETVQPQFTQFIQKVYKNLFQIVIDNEFPLSDQKIITRMAQYHPAESEFEGKLLDPNTPAVCVALARAGILPSEVIFQLLHDFLQPKNIRQDHVYISRTTNEKNEVTGSHMNGSKIGGGIKNSFVMLPDPMGATGSTIIEVINHYKKNIEGPAKKFIAIHLIITPEYIEKMQKMHPDVQIYAIRLDRGFSSPKALQSEPGEIATEERGLNQYQYIVPGGGGFGEILNNSFV